MSPAFPIRLIIFDCDGVRVDSEPLAMRVLLKALADAGLDVSTESGFRNYLGRSFSSIAQSLDDLHGLRLDDAAIEAMRLDLYETYRRELKPMAGLLDVLPELGIPFCVASSSQMDRIRTSLEITGLMERFQPTIFSATMVENGKPAPADPATVCPLAGAVSATGALLARAEHPIDIRRADANHAEHDSEQIWQAIGLAVKSAMNLAKAKPQDVAGISFDATCSLVVRDRDGAPLPG